MVGHESLLDELKNTNVKLKLLARFKHHYADDYHELDIKEVDTFFEQRQLFIKPVVWNSTKVNLFKYEITGDKRTKGYKKAVNIYDELVNKHTAFLKELEKKKKLKFTNCLKYIKESLQAIYPDNWDIEVAGYDYAMVYIHFPKFYIRSYQTKHLIKDLYLRFGFNTEFKLYKKLQGYRSTITCEEWDSDYTHSHLNHNFNLSSINDYCFENFCLGRGPIEKTQNSLVNKFDELEFDTYLFQIIDILNWESGQGGPYRRIRNIASSNELVPLKSKDVNSIYNLFIKKYSQFPLKFENSKFIVDHNDVEFEKMLTEICDDKVKVIKLPGRNCYTNKLDEESRKTRIKDLNSRLKSYDLYNFNFKGKNVSLKIDETLTDVTKGVKVIHPSLKKLIAYKLTKSINCYYLRKQCLKIK